MSVNSSKFALNRRQFLSLAWIGVIAVLAWQTLLVFVRIANPHGLGSLLGGIVSVGSVDSLPPSGDAPVEDADNRLWIMNTQEGLLALDKRCTHLDCLLGWDGQEREFFCPCHGSRFAQDGTWIEGPAPRGMDRYVVRMTDGDDNLLAITDVETGAPLQLQSEASDDSRGDADTAINGEATVWVNMAQKISGPPAV